ncbi:MAG: RDD family protein [Flavobacteriales bacterium]|nr:RDD family protein [Flavobacteriales bacterium]
MENIRILTTQNVGIDQELATLSDRSWAWVFDRLVIIAWIVLLFQFRDVFGDTNTTESTIVFLTVLLLPIALYHLFFEIFANGQSIGKIIMRIKVIRTDGAQPTLANYLIRWLLRIVEFTLFNGLGLVAFLVINKGQRLGDLFAGTTVIRTRRISIEETAFKQIDPNYKPTYPQVMNLSHRDIETIKEATHFFDKHKNYIVLAEAYIKVREYLGIEERNAAQYDFLQTVVNDFNHYKLVEYYNA